MRAGVSMAPVEQRLLSTLNGEKYLYKVLTASSLQIFFFLHKSAISPWCLKECNR